MELDLVTGGEIYPLTHDDGTVDAIHARHVLQHFSHRQAPAVLKEWARVLRIGGSLRVAVPEGAMIDREYLRGLFDAAGLVLLRPWAGEAGLALEGTKPSALEFKVSAAMSVPRLGFMDNFSSCFDGLVPLGIRLRRQGGAFWGQALTKCLEIILDADKPDAILVLDYDTVFELRHVAHLMQLMMCHPEVDALAPIQSSRHLRTALFTVEGPDGKATGRIPFTAFEPDIQQILTAHFGLTLIRADKLRTLPKPWFYSTPDAEGRWEDGKIDDDIQFWKAWRENGNTLYLANRVAVGHAELMIRWPGKDLQAIYQPMTEFHKGGVPDGAWS